MKVFRLLQQQYAIVGISSSNPSSDQKLPSSIRILIGFATFGWNIVSLFLYIFYVANGFMEYMVCICVTSGTLIIFVCFAAIVYRKARLFELIDNIEELIDTSESISFLTIERMIWMKIRTNWCFFRTEVSEIRSIFLQNLPADWTIEWNHFYGGNEDIIAVLYATKIHWQLCHLFCHRFGRRLVWIAYSNMVNFIMKSSE